MKTKAIKCIYLIWRKGRGARRIKIGVIRRSSNGLVRFNYIKENVRQAREEGFLYYPDFPDIDKIYTEKVIEIFGQRLNNSERSDIHKYYDFWEISPENKDDKFYLLAQTQGLLPTDNFEFIADYHLTKKLCFISEVCGLSKNPIQSGTLQEGESLVWKLEKDNLYDKNAVGVYREKQKIGYIKAIHCNVFHEKKASNIRIRVKSLDQNGHINRIFIKIYVD